VSLAGPRRFHRSVVPNLVRLFVGSDIGGAAGSALFGAAVLIAWIRGAAHALSSGELTVGMWDMR